MTRKEILKDLIIDFKKPKGYKTKDWLAMERIMEENRGKITKFRHASGKEFTEVKNKKLLVGGFEVKKVKFGGGKTLFKPYTEYRYGEFDQHSLKSSTIDYYKGFMRPFKVNFQKRRKR